MSLPYTTYICITLYGSCISEGQESVFNIHKTHLWLEKMQKPMPVCHFKISSRNQLCKAGRSEGRYFWTWPTINESLVDHAMWWKQEYQSAIPGFVRNQPWVSREVTSPCGWSYQKNYKVPFSLKKKKKSLWCEAKRTLTLTNASP